MDLQQIFNDTDFVHTSGTKEELQVAGYLKMQCAIGANTWVTRDVPRNSKVVSGD